MELLADSEILNVATGYETSNCLTCAMTESNRLMWNEKQELPSPKIIIIQTYYAIGDKQLRQVISINV